ncbi:hypothetical protein EV363DRAFT_1551692 [Boletus edulis]|nr:hypothetical protein EV363DRAFT_1551692 [Boletus edulis]
MPKHHVDPITGATHVKFLEPNINDNLSREKTFCITRADLTLLEPCAADVLPLQMAVDTQPLNFPEDGHIPEILLKIFGQDILNARDLAAIARTCRAFKEPALDVLWSVLEDVSPLARCLSDVSRRKYENNPRSGYVFAKPLTQAEWDILRSYTCRIRRIRRFDFGVDWKSFRTESAPLAGPSIPSSLFPNLRYVQCGHWHTNKIGQLPPRQPLPSLLSVEILYPHPAVPILQQCLKWFSEVSPNVKEVYAHSKPPVFDPGFIQISSEHICGWRHLETVSCPNVTMDMNTLVHLSRIPALTTLYFLPTMNIAPAPPDSPLLFSNLHNMDLPAIEDLAVGTPDCPPGSVGSFFSALETACINHSITQLSFDCGNSTTTNFRDPILTFDDVRPMMAFSNLHHLDLDVSWDVGLTDDDLVKLASAWPYLEHLGINVRYGWGTRVVSGITPDGLFHLLQTCPSLCHLCLAIDTRGYTQVSPDRSPATLAFQSRDTFCIDVVDSVIEEESVQAMATYLAGMAPRATRVWLYSWGFEGHQGWRMPVDRLQEVYKARWKEAYRRANLMRRPRDNSSTVSCRIL